jgi:hypothetical protein
MSGTDMPGYANGSTSKLAVAPAFFDAGIAEGLLEMILDD